MLARGYTRAVQATAPFRLPFVAALVLLTAAVWLEPSGTPLAEQASTNGAGNLVIGSVESSNVDIATEFSNLIVAQQAYSANAKMVTTAQQMLETTVDMKQ